MMITLFIFLPLIAALILCLVPHERKSVFRWSAVLIAFIEVLFVLFFWIGFEAGAGIQFEHFVSWFPDLGINYRVGLDGISLPLVAMTAVLFLAVFIFSLSEEKNIKTYVILFLLLQTTCFGLFAALDLIVFFLFWDLALIFMFLAIAMWGHEDRRRAALKFLIYTFVGSLSLMLGIIGLYLMSDPHTFDMVEIAAQNPLAGSGTQGVLIFLALGIGFAIKTPVFPFHTWLPPAHVQASAAGSAILAGVLLKMGTYGFVRISMTLAPEQWIEYAWIIAAIGLVSVLYGALVALGQRTFKALIAYTSVNHMGYVILALGIVGIVGAASEEMQTIALSGAVTQMVAHGLVTGLLFLITGMLYKRTGTYEFDRLGGLLARVPLLAFITIIAAVASFGIPGFAHFVAELQIFIGVIGTSPGMGVPALLGVLIIAGALVYSIQRIFLGPLKEEWSKMPGLNSYELWAAALLIICFTIIGVYPSWVIDVIRPAALDVIHIINLSGQ